MKKWPIITGAAALVGACAGALLFARKKLSHKKAEEGWESEDVPVTPEPDQVFQESDMLPDEEENQQEEGQPE